jgi:hypothetical protein
MIWCLSRTVSSLEPMNTIVKVEPGQRDALSSQRCVSRTLASGCRTRQPRACVYKDLGHPFHKRPCDHLHEPEQLFFTDRQCTHTRTYPVQHFFADAHRAFVIDCINRCLNTHTHCDISTCVHARVNRCVPTRVLCHCHRTIV